MRSVVSGLVVFSLLGSAAWAQSDGLVEVARAKSYSLPAVGIASAGYSAVGPRDAQWTIVTIHDVFDPPVERRPAPPRYFARRLVHTSDGKVAVSFADTATCPALREALGRMTRLEPPRLELPRLAPYVPMGSSPVLDGALYSVWSNLTYQSDGTAAQVEASSRSGQIARWYAATTAATQSCWSPAAPSPRR